MTGRGVGTAPLGEIRLCVRVNGRIRARELDKPGFGVTLNPKVALTRPYPRATKSFADIAAAKAARTMEQSEWLRRAEVAIPLGQGFPTKA